MFVIYTYIHRNLLRGPLQEGIEGQIPIKILHDCHGDAYKLKEQKDFQRQRQLRGVRSWNL